MAGQAGVFVDYYALLGCTPNAAVPHLKRAYFDKLLEFHPDKQRGPTAGDALQVTQALNEAWSVLKDTEKRQSYDALWRKERASKAPKAEAAEQQKKVDQSEQEVAPRRSERAEPEAEPQRSAEQRADELRREGNELYKAAVAITKQHGTSNLYGATMALQRYEAAVERYSQGIELDPHSHLLHNNRALCYAALKDWQKCRMDALRVTMLKPDFMKGWFLLVKSLWRLGSCGDALRELDTALRVVPGSPDLLLLQEELQREAESWTQRSGREDSSVSRNVSPACTPPPLSPLYGSRAPTPTPPPLRKPGPPSRQRSVSKGRRLSPEPPPEPDDSRGATVTFGSPTAQATQPLGATATFAAAAQAPPPTAPPTSPLAASPEGPPPLPLPRRGNATSRLPSLLRQRFQERRPPSCCSTPARPESAQSCGEAFGAAHLAATFGARQEPSPAGPQRRPSPEPNSDGSWSCGRATASFGRSSSRGLAADGQRRQQPARSPSSFDVAKAKTCSPDFFAEAAAAVSVSETTAKSQRLGVPELGNLGSLSCTVGAWPRAQSLTARSVLEPSKPAVPQSDGKSLREVILFGARAYESKDKLQ